MNLGDLPYTRKIGALDKPDIVIFALSTCGFCKRAMSFLDDRGYSYRYLYVDTIPIEQKNEIKTALRERFKENVAFPFAVFDDSSHLVGFIQPDWERSLGIGAK
ncbi:MAG TPA: glutaredoxin [Rectinemataceae bacterium]